MRDILKPGAIEDQILIRLENSVNLKQLHIFSNDHTFLHDCNILLEKWIKPQTNLLKADKKNAFMKIPDFSRSVI